MCLPHCVPFVCILTRLVLPTIFLEQPNPCDRDASNPFVLRANRLWFSHLALPELTKAATRNVILEFSRYDA
jgi:hypothetical protein